MRISLTLPQVENFLRVNLLNTSRIDSQSGRNDRYDIPQQKEDGPKGTTPKKKRTIILFPKILLLWLFLDW